MILLTALNVTFNGVKTRLLSPCSVRGVEGVRVVDASVMPQVVTTNVMSTVIMIAEKTADIIKQHFDL